MTSSLLKPHSPAEWDESRRLVEEYAASIEIDLSFQSFAQELDQFADVYAPPSGAFLLAREKRIYVGCVGLRKLSDTVGEIKRLYVSPAARGLGLGEALVQGIVDEGKRLGYARLVLDTLPSMVAARSLYQTLGFKPIAPYRYNPVAGTAFLELRLDEQASG